MCICEIYLRRQCKWYSTHNSNIDYNFVYIKTFEFLSYEYTYRCFWCNATEFTKKNQSPHSFGRGPIKGDFDFFGEFHGITPKTPMFITNFVQMGFSKIFDSIST